MTCFGGMPEAALARSIGDSMIRSQGLHRNTDYFGCGMPKEWFDK